MDILVEEIELLIVKTAERNGGRRFYLFFFSLNMIDLERLLDFYF